MKLNKIGVFLFTSALLLTSCSKKSIAGIYGFQMGKEKGTHFGLFLELTDNYTTLDSEPDVTNKYKKGEFSFSFKDGEKDDQDDDIDIMTFIGELLHQEGDTVKIPCYYYVGNKIPKSDETELKIGIDFSFIKDLVDDGDKDDLVFPV